VSMSAKRNKKKKLKIKISFRPPINKKFQLFG
jgi:hypothetical protein